jgi:hypothetical protein
VTHSRTVVRVGDYFVVVDRLKSEAEHVYDFYLHSEGQLNLDGGQARSEPVASPSQWIEAPEALAARAAVSGRWFEGLKGVEFWLGGSTSVTPVRAQCPAETGSRKVPLLIGRQQGKRAEFFAVLFAYEGRYGISVERHDDELIIQHEGFSDRLKVAPHARPSVSRERH